ncbi:hypothetical protein [Olleya sp. UBA1516]|uniref:hypothetical protein n=1 Tax=Olleya sp. UBA1516 TaxID=1947013 RepID=UPI0025D9AF46|nr:hypothetical protein [Olleya sp. UBA1516]|tara:strand:- start:23955 stop:24797 length:843 start_codon:yes stop_codon:yes gene_type:complete
MKKIALLTLLLITSYTFANTRNTTKNVNSIQIIRLDYNAPNGASRELVLAFTSDNAATDGVDYGYDAAVYSPFTNDLNWLIDSNRYVIQGVGQFQNTSQYLFGLYNEVSGEASITLSSLENFNTDINVYIYDALLNTYTNINDTPFTGIIDAGDYTDRFYIAFEEPEILDIDTNNEDIIIDSFNALGNNENPPKPDNNATTKSINLSYDANTNQLNLKFENNAKVKNITVYNYKGIALKTIEKANNNKINIPLNTNDKNLILHITTDTEVIVKQIALNSN